MHIIASLPGIHLETTRDHVYVPSVCTINQESIKDHGENMWCNLEYFIEISTIHRTQAMIRGLELLYALGALDDKCKLTPDLGEKMAGT